MMTDRELLEFAAKASGINLDVFIDNKTIRRDKDGQPIYWNPLTDDGDALRLAISINLRIFRFETMCTVQPMFCNWAVDERDDGDKYAATRRAIVRAAAEIGKSMT